MRVERKMTVSLRTIHGILKESGYTLPPVGKVTVHYELKKDGVGHPRIEFTWYQNENDFVDGAFR